LPELNNFLSILVLLLDFCNFLCVFSPAVGPPKKNLVVYFLDSDGRIGRD